MHLTLITATYNSADTIRDTLESVLAQTYTDLEYWVIDGGSTDGTMDVVRQYEPRFKGRLHSISEADKGIYDAMNKGIHLANGDVVGLLNSDDFLSSDDAVAQQMERLEKTGADAVYGDVRYVDWSDTRRGVRYYSSKNFKRWKMRLGLMPAHPTFYCRKEIYEKYGYFDQSYKIAADFECLLRFIFIHRIRIAYNPMQVVTMRSGGKSSDGLASRKQIMRDHLRAFKTHGIYTNTAILSLRYFGKVWDLAVGKVRRKNR